LLAAEGMMSNVLPVVLGSAGTLSTCLDHATKEMNIPNARKMKLYNKLPSTQYTQSTKPCVPTAIPGKTKANSRSTGKNKRQIASLCTPTCP
jgi:hypothetical protein